MIIKLYNDGRNSKVLFHKSKKHRTIVVIGVKPLVWVDWVEILSDKEKNLIKKYMNLSNVTSSKVLRSYKSNVREIYIFTNEGYILQTVISRMNK